MFKTIENSNSFEFVEKKSKFIANIFYVECKIEADKILKDVKKKYYDAKHNCYAYRIKDGEDLLEKSSDDGEPSGTAGNPILANLRNNDLKNILVIVTRYFGGILLGTGGLTRAYSNATAELIKQTKIITKNKYSIYEIEIEYDDLSDFNYYAKKNNIIIKNEEYLEKIKLEIAIEDINVINNINEKEINVKKIKYICDAYI